VYLSGLTAGEEVSELREVLLSAGGAPPITSVKWLVDGQQVAESKESPFLFEFNPKDYGEGEHTLRAIVDASGAPLEDSVTFRSAPPPPAPASRMPIILIALMALAAIGGAGAYIMMRVRKMEQVGVQAISADQRVNPMSHTARRTLPPPPTEMGEVEQESIGEALGILISRSGPDLGQQYRVGGQPVSIGSGARCGVRVADPDLALEEARIWVRGGHLMLHKFTKLVQVEKEGASAGGWVFLDPGDVFQIGQHSFEFQLLPDVEQAPAPRDPSVPDILRERGPETPDAQRPQLDMGPRA
jgi:hypothetical protein